MKIVTDNIINRLEEIYPTIFSSECECACMAGFNSYSNNQIIPNYCNGRCKDCHQNLSKKEAYKYKLERNLMFKHYSTCENLLERKICCGNCNTCIFNTDKVLERNNNNDDDITKYCNQYYNNTCFIRCVKNAEREKEAYIYTLMYLLATKKI